MAFSKTIVDITTSAAVLYECPANVSGSAHGLVVSNTSATAQSFSLSLYLQATGLTKQITGSAQSVAANGQFVWPKPINMQAGDRIIAQATVNGALVGVVSVYTDVSQIPTPLNIRGAYSSAATYQKNDIVSVPGAVYVAFSTVNNVAPPAAQWSLLLETAPADWNVSSGFGAILNKPTTIAGYGITDAAAKVHTHAIADVTNLQSTLNSLQPTSAKNAANGYAGLDGSGKVLTSQLPASVDTSGLQPKSEKGVANGYPSLDSSGKVPAAQLPPIAADTTGLQQTNQKNAANGYAGLDSSGKISAAQIPAGAGATGLQPTSEKNAVNGYAGLDGAGKLASGLLPDAAIVETSVVATQAAMLALTAQKGDLAVRADLSKTYVLKAEPASTLANWQEILASGGSVTSVSGRAGAVTLTKDDVGLANVDNTADSVKPISTAQQTALNAKSSVGHKHPLTDLLPSGATAGQVLTFDGTNWVAANPPAATGSAPTTSGAPPDYYLLNSGIQ